MHATNLQNFLKLCEENVQSLNEKEENTSTSKEFLDKKKKKICAQHSINRKIQRLQHMIVNY